jgi:hypothetical protein
MNLIVSFSLFVTLVAGCSSFPGHIPPSSTVLPPQLKGYFVRPEFPGSESLFIPLKKRLASRYINLYTPQFGGDAEHDYLWVSASWSIDSGFEGAFHSTLIFAKKKTESDWANARIWEGTTAHQRPFNGPIERLEVNREFGVIEPQKKKPNKSPEPTSGSVTDRADARSAPVPPVAHL